MIQKPKRWLAIAAGCAVAFFLLGAPEITDNPGAIQQMGIWLQAGVGLVGLAALGLGVVGLFTRSAASE